MNMSLLPAAIKGVAGAATLALLSPVSLSYAQETNDQVEEVVVTGSRIKRQDLESTAPLDIVSAAQIEMSGATSIAELVNKLPAITGVTTSTSNGLPTSAVNMRGLPSTSTLVLINGRRAALAADTGEAFDINSIPPAAVERIEVLKDGASAVYGSDAIAGVVNVILKDDFEGLHISAESSMPDQKGGEKSAINLMLGTSTDKASFMVGANYSETSFIWSRDRDVSRMTPQPSSAVAEGRATVSGYAFDDAGVLQFTGNSADSAVVTLKPGASGASLSDYQAVDWGYNYQEVTSEMPKQDRTTVFARGSYKLTDTVEASLDLMHSETSVLDYWAFTPIFSAFELGNQDWSADNPYNIFGQDVSDWRRRTTDTGLPRIFDYSMTLDQAVLELDGEFSNGWSWNTGFVKSKSLYDQQIGNVINKELLRLAVGDPDACAVVAGCVPTNPIANAGEMPEEQWSFFVQDVQETGVFRTETFSFDVTGEAGELAGGAIGLAFGIEHREENYSTQPDTLQSNFNTIGTTNHQATRGDRSISELYGEALLPVMDNLDVSFALRHSDYSDLGSATNPKLGIEYRATDELKLRATYSTGFRAPSLLEMYRGASEAFDFLGDPCADPAAVNSAATPGCTEQSDPALFQFLTITTGNAEELKAEESESFTLGAVWQSDFGINVRLDYFDILQENAIDNPKQYILDDAAAGGPLANRVIRDANFNIKRVDVTYLNLAERQVRGIDLGADYAFELLDGSMSVGADITQYLEFNDQAYPGAAVIDRVGTIDLSSNIGLLPEFKATSFVTWSSENIETSMSLQWLDSIDDLGSAGAKVDSYTRTDLSAMYTFDNGVKVGVGINNLFDAEPPFIGDSPEGYDANSYDITGRAAFLKLSANLGE
ncbi:TonB-dependent receptor [Microbulbifer agarilyticus]